MCDQKNGVDCGDDVEELSASDESDPEEQPCGTPFDPELDDYDDDDDHNKQQDFSSATTRDTAQNPFSLRGGSSAFTNRSHSVFDCLDTVAQPSPLPPSRESVTDEDNLFARPLPPPPNRRTQPQVSCPVPSKKRGVPDYLMHPERWTYYSLEDVTEMNDKDNSRAAHNFLTDLQQRKEQQKDHEEDPCEVQHKMIFSRPSIVLKDQSSHPLSDIKGKKTETRLSHLEEDDDGQEGREKIYTRGKKTDQSVEKDTIGQLEEGPVIREKDEEDDKEASKSFSFFKKTKHKNYRKSSGREEN